MKKCYTNDVMSIFENPFSSTVETSFTGVGGRFPADFAWLTQTSNFALDYSYARYPYRIDLAQTIRDLAGVPMSETAGLENGESAGLTNSGALAARVAHQNWTVGQLELNASSGNGTREDPWIIKDSEFGFLDLQGDNPGWTQFENCLFKDSSNFEFQARQNFLGNLIFKNCEFTSTATNFWMMRFASAKGNVYRFENCHFKGKDATAIIGLWTDQMTDGEELTVEMRNCVVDETDVNYDTDSSVINTFFDSDENVSIGINIDIRHCEFTGNTGGENVIAIKGVDTFPSIIFNNNHVEGFDSVIRNLESSYAPLISNFECVNTYAEDCRKNIIFLANCKKGLLSNSEFRHTTTGQGYRTVVFRGYQSSELVADLLGTGPENIDVVHCIVDKQVGSFQAGDENLESFNGKNIRFRWCWSPNSPEDPFEHARVIKNCTIEYCVGDNTEGQIADFWMHFNESKWKNEDETDTLEQADIYCHHIYGDCKDYPVQITSINGGAVHSIYADNSAAPATSKVGLPIASVLLRERISQSITFKLRNIYVSGPLPLAADRADKPVHMEGGANLEARYFDNESGSGSITIETV